MGKVRMHKNRRKTLGVWQAVVTAGIVLLFNLASGPVVSAAGIDADADNVLRSMSAYLSSLSTFSMNADIDNEIITHDGQKLQLSSVAMLVLERPGKFHVQRKGMFADAEFIFDGNTLTLYGKRLNVYAQTDVSGTIDDAIRALEIETGLDAPGADLLLSDTYGILASGVERGVYIGVAYVNGIACHHLAFREKEVDWQLWVQTGEQPLPMKYVITSKWMTGAPQYTVQLRDWNTKPQIKAGQFEFTMPKGARRLDTIPVNEIGEMTLKEDK